MDTTSDGSALRCVVFPPGAKWAHEEGKWVCVNQ